ncbi:ornithine--oxo-acid transaminase [Niveispirillum irakense]|uniref:ornithine--oxo-acid transaminase n=1 Tax=Niveispirillum irakense TaxID=34011 RepID=UPI000423AD2A|nr:ornithine--oxo-acid transaminase [Niveispirillum irakense]
MDMQMNLSAEAISVEQRWCAHNYKPLPVVIDRAEGVWMWDVEGTRYLDMMSAYSAVNLGHGHPRILRAMIEQASRVAVISRAFHSEKLGPFLRRLCALSGLDGACPMNTGAEAVETAIKAARRWGYKVKGIPADQAEILVAEGNFHGRTSTIVGFSSEAAYRDGFGPFAPGFRIIPYGDADAMEAAIGPNTAAILVEPIQGEAGIVVPPEGYLRRLREICDRRNVLLILDEIQSGLGRTGKWFAFQHEGIVPDGLCLGKALGGGVMPVSAFVARQDLIDMFVPGNHGSTFGGNPLAAAVGLEALETLDEEGLVARSAELGDHMMRRLSAIDSPAIRAVRGRGLWVGVEIDPAFATARAVCEALMQRGVLSKETHDTVIRFAPPLVISREELDWAIDRFAETLAAMRA